MSVSPIETISEDLQTLGDAAQLFERPYDKCGFHREITCPVDAIVNIAQTFQKAEYFLEMIAATDCEGKASLSYTFNRLGDPDRTLVRLTFDYETEVPSLSDIYPGANWYEREAWEMVGVTFSGHPGLKQLLLPEDADFNPLRKDYGIPKAVAAARAKFKKVQERKAAAAKKKTEAKEETADRPEVSEKDGKEDSEE